MILGGLFDEGRNHDETNGTALHYYLSRTSNIHLDTVKLLVKAFPAALSLRAEDGNMTPLHVLCHVSYLGDEKVNDQDVKKFVDILNFMIESNPSALKAIDCYGRIPLHLICHNLKADKKIPAAAKCLLEHWSDSVNVRDNEVSKGY